MKRVLFVAIEQPWPPNQGGRVRMAGLVAGLSTAHDVTVVTWNAEPSASPVPVHSLSSDPERSRLAGFASPKPRIARQLLGASAASDLAKFARSEPFDAVVYSHSYLASALRLNGLLQVVDFANVESNRYRQFARSRQGLNRASAWIEYVKACRWEPRVTQEADLVTVLSIQDQEWVRQFTRHSILVPNGVAAVARTSPSPADGPALFFASMDYGPNLDAATSLIADVWPLVRAHLPDARLLIAGRNSHVRLGASPGPGVSVVGEVNDLTRLYREAAMVLAPVATGGGRQLKVIEALAHHRTLACSPHSLQSVPEELQTSVLSAATNESFAEAVVEVLADSQTRWKLEERIRRNAHAIPTWQAAVTPLADWLERHA